MKAFLVWVGLIVCAIIAWPVTVTVAAAAFMDWLTDGEVLGLYKPKKK